MITISKTSALFIRFHTMQQGARHFRTDKGSKIDLISNHGQFEEREYY